jgi:enediyne biosynthesis protein E4
LGPVTPAFLMTRRASLQSFHLLLALLLAVDWVCAAPAGLDWNAVKGFRAAKVTVPAQGKDGFTLLDPATTGVRFTNVLSDKAAVENQIRLNGSGVALGDVDGDGLCDIYFCGLENANALYRNLGHWRFQDVTRAAGVACDGQFSMGAALTDVDGDGDLDLIITALGAGTRLFRNDGKGQFTEATDCGLVRRFGATSVALADIDGNGTLDLYVANNRTTTVRDTGLNVLRVGNQRVIRPEDREQLEITPQGQILEYGESSILYLNDGQGRFTATSWTQGAFRDEEGAPLAAPPRDWGLAAMFRDMNGDGAPDLYTCNDFFTPDRIWINDGHGNFRAMAREAVRCTSLGSMAVDFADINRDGFDDFLVVDMMPADHRTFMVQREPNAPSPDSLDKYGARPQVQRNTLQLNRGDGTFAEMAQFSGLEASGWSWGIVFLDVDLDGFEDVLTIAGHGFDTLDRDAAVKIDRLPPEERRRRLLHFPPGPAPKMAFRNRGDLTFENTSARWGFDQTGVTHGMALADLDNDGDLDVVVNNNNAVAGIYRNETVASRLAVRLKGLPPNTRGIGAKIKVFRAHGVPASAGKTSSGQTNILPAEAGTTYFAQTQEMISGGRYCSSDDTLRVFAGRVVAPPTTAGFTIEVTWRNGRQSIVTNALANHVYEIEESGSMESRLQPAERLQDPGSSDRLKPGLHAPLFGDVSNSLNHRHTEAAFDGFARQPLLPHRVDRLGPGVTWFDVDQDGSEDLLVAAGRGCSTGVLLNQRNGTFRPVRLGGVLAKTEDDQISILGFIGEGGDASLLIGHAAMENEALPSNAVHRIDFWAGGISPKPGIPSWSSSAGPMALADIDGDGDLDLFVGGRVVPGRYPEAAESRLFRNDAGRFTRAAAWPGLGLVSGAVFTDLNGDGFPELVLACEWGPVKFFNNNRGQLTEATEAWGMTSVTGWWNGVAAGDFDGDGRLDLVASNWGRNTKYQRHRQEDVRVYYGDWTGEGTIGIIEARYDTGMGRFVPSQPLDVLAASLPFVREKFTSHRQFGEAGTADVLGGRTASELTAHWLTSMVFLNRGDRFEVHMLPTEAQMAPAFAVCVADFDGDAKEDVFLSQNFFAVHPETSRYDAGRGLLLRGNGRGSFNAVPGQESGIRIYGEQRGAAACDFDADGRVDLAVAQNSSQTRLLHNERAKPGLRVRLIGPPGNRGGIGAIIRMLSDGQPGPAREVHAGSGYCSQDSAVQVLASGGNKIQVQWPGGKQTTGDVPASAREISVSTGGDLKVLR